MKKTFTYLLLILFLTSCASQYKTIKPENITYTSHSIDNNVKFSYEYDFLTKKYSKKESKKGIKLASIKIENNSNEDLIFGDNLILVDDSGKDLLLLEKETAFKKLKQLPLTHLLYLLLTPINVFSRNENTNGTENDNDIIPVGLVIGPSLAIGNMVVASSANKKFKKDLEKYNLKGSTIKKGDTKYGLIAIKTDNFKSLKLKTTN